MRWMPRIGVALLLTCGLFGPAVGRAGAPEAVYLALGDSLAVGVGAERPGEGGYATRTMEQLQANGVAAQLVNLAISGETSASLFTSGQLDRAAATIRDRSVDTRVVTLHIGGNDLLWLLFRGPCPLDPVGPECRQLVTDSMAGFAENYPKVLQTLSDAMVERGNGTVLYVNTYYNVFSGTNTIYEAPVERALLGDDLAIDCTAAAADPGNLGLNDVIACVAPAYGARVVDHHPRFQGQGLALTLIRRTDPHPNDAGHRAIAETLAEAILGAAQ